MNDWARRLGSVLLTSVEVLLALVVLSALWMLLDVRAGVESGAYNPEAASGFAIGFFALWLLSYGAFATVVGGHAVFRAVIVAGDHGLDAIGEATVRVVAELLVAAALLVALVGGETSYGPFGLVLGASAVMATGLLVHVAADAALFAKEHGPGD